MYATQLYTVREHRPEVVDSVEVFDSFTLRLARNEAKTLRKANPGCTYTLHTSIVVR